jgi:hypothetical protein
VRLLISDLLTFTFLSEVGYTKHIGCLIMKLRGKMSPRVLTRRLEGSNRMLLKIICKDVDWTNLAHGTGCNVAIL